MSDPTFFRTAGSFGRWLARHGTTERELWVGFYKKGSGRVGMTYAEAVEQALCHGWIDGIIRRLDAERYMHRFSPRKPGGHWSAVNIAKAKALLAEGRMSDAGRAAFEGHEQRRAPYSHEQAPRDLDPAQQRALRTDPAAWRFWQRQPPSYRKAVVWWLASARRESTRERRLAQLVTCCAEARRIPQFVSPAPR